MNENRFDDLSRRLAAATSRRGILKTLGAMIAGAALARFDVETAEAGAGVCINGQRLVCDQFKKCVCEDVGCPRGQPKCNGACTDTLSSPSNCGACGHDCGGLACVNGVCTFAESCPSLKQFNPNQLLADYQADPFNCGGCGIQCKPCERCTNGACAPICVSAPSASRANRHSDC